MGVGSDGNESYATLVFVHASEEEATLNSRILQTKIDSEVSYQSGRPWSETIARSEIEVKGTLVQAKLWIADPLFLLRAWTNIDGLFMSRP
jgi:hypothetical protein